MIPLPVACFNPIVGFTLELFNPVATHKDRLHISQMDDKLYSPFFCEKKGTNSSLCTLWETLPQMNFTYTESLYTTFVVLRLLTDP